MKKAPNLDGQGKPVQDTRAYDHALAQMLLQPVAGQEERWHAWAKHFGINPKLTGKARFDALKAALGWTHVKHLPREPGQDDEERA